MFEALASAGLDFIGKKQEQRWAKQAAGRQMDFQERMSNTAYQRAMADMKTAGINPIMVTKLGGASTPTGAMAKTPDMGKMGSDAMKNYATAQQVHLTNAQTKNVTEQSKVHKTTADYNSAKTLVEEQRAKTEQLIQQEKRANIEGKKIANTLALQTQQYFKKLGYPPQVLQARWQNIAGTFVWENLSDQNKQQLVVAINKFATSSVKNTEKFFNDPVGTMMSILKGGF